MPSPAAEQQQGAQIGLATLLLRDIAKLWPLINVGKLKTSLPTFTTAVTATLQQYAPASAELAAQFYEDERAASHVAGRYTVGLVDPPQLPEVERSVGWATKSLWSRDEPDIEAARSLVDGVTEKMMLDVGRRTLTTAVADDDQAHGWAREPEPNCCAFCAMLATRGAVYKSKDTALHTIEDEAYHPNCRCQPVPLFADVYEPSAQVREWESLYKTSTRDARDLPPALAFRRAFEGRA